jgi:hypothetical protein
MIRSINPYEPVASVVMRSHIRDNLSKIDMDIVKEDIEVYIK